MVGLIYPKEKGKKRRMRHPKSILHDKDTRTCYLCMLLNNDSRPHAILHEHHVFGGPNRARSEEMGLKVYLCPEHHEYGPLAAHRCRETRELLQRIAQREYEKAHTRQEFVQIFGRNYLQ